MHLVGQTLAIFIRNGGLRKETVWLQLTQSYVKIHHKILGFIDGPVDQTQSISDTRLSKHARELKKSLLFQTCKAVIYKHDRLFFSSYTHWCLL